MEPSRVEVISKSNRYAGGHFIEHHEKRLDVWKDADPGIPKVEDASKRLVGLKGSNFLENQFP